MNGRCTLRMKLWPSWPCKLHESKEKEVHRLEETILIVHFLSGFFPCWPYVNAFILNKSWEVVKPLERWDISDHGTPRTCFFARALQRVLDERAKAEREDVRGVAVNPHVKLVVPPVEVNSQQPLSNLHDRRCADQPRIRRVHAF